MGVQCSPGYVFRDTFVPSGKPCPSVSLLGPPGAPAQCCLPEFSGPCLSVSSSGQGPKSQDVGFLVLGHELLVFLWEPVSDPERRDWSPGGS